MMADWLSYRETIQRHWQVPTLSFQFMSRTTDPANVSSLHQEDLTNVQAAGSLPFKLFQHCQGQYRMTDGFEEVYEL